MRYAALILILLAGTANAQEFELTEEWKCQSGSYWSESNSILVVAQVMKAGDFVLGSISVAGTAYVSEYSVEGFNRRWDFGDRIEELYPYSLVIHPDGSAAYYDFSTVGVGAATSPSQKYICVQTK